MTYNLYGWNAIVQNPWKTEQMVKAIRWIQPDVMGAQEVDNAWDINDRIGDDFSIVDGSAGHNWFYRTSVLRFDEASGSTQLNEMDHWGPVSCSALLPASD